jgi:hypothetical protein
MKIGVNSFLWTETLSTNDFGILDRLATAGLDGIEIGLLDPSDASAGSGRTEAGLYHVLCHSTRRKSDRTRFY